MTAIPTKLTIKTSVKNARGTNPSCTKTRPIKPVAKLEYPNALLTPKLKVPMNKTIPKAIRIMLQKYPSVTVLDQVAKQKNNPVQSPNISVSKATYADPLVIVNLNITATKAKAIDINIKVTMPCLT